MNSREAQREQWGVINKFESKGSRGYNAEHSADCVGVPHLND